MQNTRSTRFLWLWFFFLISVASDFFVACIRSVRRWPLNEGVMKLLRFSFAWLIAVGNDWYAVNYHQTLIFCVFFGFSHFRCSTKIRSTFYKHFKCYRELKTRAIYLLLRVSRTLFSFFFFLIIRFLCHSIDFVRCQWYHRSKWDLFLSRSTGDYRPSRFQFEQIDYFLDSRLHRQRL